MKFSKYIFLILFSSCRNTYRDNLKEKKLAQTDLQREDIIEIPITTKDKKTEKEETIIIEGGENKTATVVEPPLPQSSPGPIEKGKQKSDEVKKSILKGIDYIFEQGFFYSDIKSEIQVNKKIKKAIKKGSFRVCFKSGVKYTDIDVNVFKDLICNVEVIEPINKKEQLLLKNRNSSSIHGVDIVTIKQTFIKIYFFLLSVS